MVPDVVDTVCAFSTLRMQLPESFAVTVADTVYGPFAYGLCSHSDSLDQFAGSDAEIGIHGNNDPSVLGTNATHGCIRMDNAAITMLSKQLPLGTPVDIVA